MPRFQPVRRKREKKVENASYRSLVCSQAEAKPESRRASSPSQSMTRLRPPLLKNQSSKVASCSRSATGASGVDGRKHLAVGQLQLDAPVAAQGLLGRTVVERLELAIAGRHQPPR